MSDVSSAEARAALLDCHERAHAALEATFFAALEALTALELGRALARWEALTEALSDHLAAEDATLLDLLDDAREPPRGASARILAPEHARLDELLAAAQATLSALHAFAEAPGSPVRSVMVRRLEPLLRAQHLLGHHHARERDLVYPFVAPQLTEAEARALTARFEATIARCEAALAVS
jgi:hypothetical protein